GVRAFDVTNPYQPQEIAYFVPPAPKLSRTGSIQLNDVYVDDRRLVYTVDRFAGGLYVLAMTICSPALRAIRCGGDIWARHSAGVWCACIERRLELLLLRYGAALTS